MSSEGAAAPHAAVTTTSARARASRINGARSRGPRTPEGKARSSQNALRHGLRAQRLVLVQGEDAAEFEALEAALVDELAPRGVLQSILAGRIARAAWRLARADRIEGELFEKHGSCDADCDLALALIRDGNGARAFPTLLRYRGAALAEFWRALHALKALQAEALAPAPVPAARPEPVPVPALEPARTRAGRAAGRAPERREDGVHSSSGRAAEENPNEPDSRTNPGHFAPERDADEPWVPEIRTSSDACRGSGGLGFEPAEPERTRTGSAAKEAPVFDAAPVP